MNDFGIIEMKYGNEFWLILFREYIQNYLQCGLDSSHPSHPSHLYKDSNAVFLEPKH